MDAAPELADRVAGAEHAARDDPSLDALRVPSPAALKQLKPDRGRRDIGLKPSRG
jgi:hypothetical protein